MLDVSLTDGYKNSSQIARVLTETWVEKNMFCPRCGNSKIQQYENNRPVADFFCTICNNEYELKSKNGKLGNKVNDGAYDTMIKRITSNSNPDFLFMSYNQKEFRVSNLILIPKHFFVPNIIEKRKPLSDTARRAGWVGCNILIHEIPPQGKISIIYNGKSQEKEEILSRTNRLKLLETNDMDNRGWMMDILSCINQINSIEFNLDEIYRFINILSIKHPDNNNIKPKIRQQLQFLREKGYIIFLSKGRYRKLL
jgi:type II restriction enzyme